MNTCVRKTISDQEHAQLHKIRKAFHTFQSDGNYYDIELDTVTILETVRLFSDSMRAYRVFHGRDANRYAQAAYWITWLLKTKPVHLKFGNLTLEEISERYTDYFDSKYDAINEHFAFGLALNMLDIKPSRIDESVQERFIDTLYRCNLDAAHLALTLEMLFGQTSAIGRADRAEQKSAAVKQLLN
jgi:hypothetical protein